MSTDLLARARTGDAEAFTALVEPYRRELQVHCYRMLGSVQDAEDALQETLLSAWRSLAAFESRSSVRTWLYRVATNRTLDALRAGTRRPPVMAEHDPVQPPEPTRLTEIAWFQPYPDMQLDDICDSAPGPESVIEAREAISLAFVTALQLLPPRQRAVLILRDVLGYRASEVAAMLSVTQESVTSALKRARATLANRPDGRPDRPAPPAPESPEERRLVDRFVDAFCARDVDGIVALLTEDAWVKMPPMPFEYQGRTAATRFFAAVLPPDGHDYRVVRTRANGQPACAIYVRDPATGLGRTLGVIVLTLSADLISEVIRFDASVLGSFGLPRNLPE
jgi:RNA polymerase sigma-70 factor (TIGR02960 family)